MPLLPSEEIARGEAEGWRRHVALPGPRKEGEAVSEQHSHLVRETHCVHGPIRSFFRGDVLGRGTGRLCTLLWHDGPREVCALPNDVPDAVPLCGRWCPHEHEFVDDACTVCRITTATLREEQEESERLQRQEDERAAASMKGLEPEILVELRAVFRRHLKEPPSDSVLAGLVNVVKHHIDWDE